MHFDSQTTSFLTIGKTQDKDFNIKSMYSYKNLAENDFCCFHRFTPLCQRSVFRRIFYNFFSFYAFSLGIQIPHCQDEEGNNVDLFELTCTPHSESSTHQMSITIKESCRKSNFLGIDFAHSFIWGDQVKILDFELRNSKSSNF